LEEDKNGRASETTRASTQLIDIFEANFGSVGKRNDKLAALVTQKGLSLHAVSRRTGHTRPFLRQQLRKLGIENPLSQNTFAPYGWDHKDGELVPNAKEQKTLVKIRALSQSHLGCKSIAKQLNQMGIPSKSGKRWGHSSVQNILNRQKKEEA
jgi:hypothetical protein